MPISDLHKKKRMKNLAILAAVTVWVILIFAVSIVKMS